MFEFLGDPQLLEVHVFVGKEYEGSITESEGKAQNSPVQNITGTFLKLQH
jgi:hypothetical protein